MYANTIQKQPLDLYDLNTSFYDLKTAFIITALILSNKTKFIVRYYWE